MRHTREVFYRLLKPMPIAFDIDVERRIIFGKAEGAISDRDLLDYQNGFRQHPDFQPDLHQLCDFRSISSVSEVTTRGIQAVTLANPFSEGARRAIVTADEVVFGLMRMLQLISERQPPEIAIFDDHGDALSWLETGVKPTRSR